MNADMLEDAFEEPVSTAVQGRPKNNAQALVDYCDHLHTEGCTLCDLGGLHGPVVVSRGSLKADLMIVGQNPGQTELRIQKPFTGPAGKLLDQQLTEAGILGKFKVYWTNVGLCGTAGNEPLNSVQAASCSVHLRTQIKLLGPAAILAVGKPALDGLCPGATVFKAMQSVGVIRDYVDVVSAVRLPVFPILHTAFILRKNDSPDLTKYYKMNMDVLAKLYGYLVNAQIEAAEPVLPEP